MTTYSSFHYHANTITTKSRALSRHHPAALIITVSSPHYHVYPITTLLRNVRHRHADPINTMPHHAITTLTPSPRHHADLISTPSSPHYHDDPITTTSSPLLQADHISTKNLPSPLHHSNHITTKPLHPSPRWSDHHKPHHDFPTLTLSPKHHQSITVLTVSPLAHHAFTTIFSVPIRTDPIPLQCITNVGILMEVSASPWADDLNDSVKSTGYIFWMCTYTVYYIDFLWLLEDTCNIEPICCTNNRTFLLMPKDYFRSLLIHRTLSVIKRVVYKIWTKIWSCSGHGTLFSFK